MPLSISATSAPQLQTPSSESKATTTLALGRVIQMERKEKEKLLEERRSKERENAPIPSARDDDEEQVESSGDDEEKTSSSRRRERERERGCFASFFFFLPNRSPSPLPPLLPSLLSQPSQSPPNGSGRKSLPFERKSKLRSGHFRADARGAACAADTKISCRNLALPPPLYFSQSPGLFVQKMRNHCRFCQQLSPPGLPPMGAEKRQGKEKKRLSRKKNDVEKKKSVRSPLRGRLGHDFFFNCLFFVSRVFFFPSSGLSFRQKHKNPQRQALANAFCRHSVFSFENRRGGAFSFFSFGKDGSVRWPPRPVADE